MIPSTTQARTVFISYAREDENLILPVAHLLRAAGAVVFLDQEDIPYGEQWESVLLEQLRISERILVFWSINAAKSEWVRREYLMAIGAGLRVVPIPLDETPLSVELATFQALTSLVPLVYQVRRSVAPRRVPASVRLPRLPSPWIGAALMAIVITIALSSTVTLSRVPSYRYERPQSALWPEAGIWVLGALSLILLIGFLTVKWASVQRRGKDLQAAIYDTIFGETANGEGA